MLPASFHAFSTAILKLPYSFVSPIPTLLRVFAVKLIRRRFFMLSLPWLSPDLNPWSVPRLHPHQRKFFIAAYSIFHRILIPSQPPQTAASSTVSVTEAALLLPAFTPGISHFFLFITFSFIFLCPPAKLKLPIPDSLKLLTRAGISLKQIYPLLLSSNKRGRHKRSLLWHERFYIRICTQKQPLSSYRSINPSYFFTISRTFFKPKP